MLNFLCFLHFCIFCVFWIFVVFCSVLLLFYSILYFFTNSWRRRVFLYFYLFAFLHFCVRIAGTFWHFDILRFWYFDIFNTNFHAKSGLCSSKNEWVMLNLVFGSSDACAATSVPVTNLHIELNASRQLITVHFYIICVFLLLLQVLSFPYFWSFCIFCSFLVFCIFALIIFLY